MSKSSGEDTLSFTDPPHSQCEGSLSGVRERDASARRDFLDSFSLYTPPSATVHRNRMPCARPTPCLHKRSSLFYPRSSAHLSLPLDIRAQLFAYGEVHAGRHRLDGHELLDRLERLLDDARGATGKV